MYRITANSFLYGMVRALVGTMLETADGKRSPDNLTALLDQVEDKNPGRSAAGPSAPAHGLTLTGVGYEDLEL